MPKTPPKAPPKAAPHQGRPGWKAAEQSGCSRQGLLWRWKCSTRSSHGEVGSPAQPRPQPVCGPPARVDLLGRCTRQHTSSHRSRCRFAAFRMGLKAERGWPSQALRGWPLRRPTVMSDHSCGPTSGRRSRTRCGMVTMFSFIASKDATVEHSW